MNTQERKNISEALRQIDRQINRQIHGKTDTRTERQTNNLIHGRTNRLSECMRGSPGFNVWTLLISSVTLSSSDTGAPQQPALPEVSAARYLKNTPVSSPCEQNVEK